MHLTGAKVLLVIAEHVAAPEYGHMIQSKQLVPASAPNENSKVPEEAIFTIIHVLFNSPEFIQPSFEEAGFVNGFETLDPVVNSTTDPDPLGSI